MIPWEIKNYKLLISEQVLKYTVSENFFVKERKVLRHLECTYQKNIIHYSLMHDVQF